jgi:3-oxoacyl-[acyl-carrier protein] reductase
MPDTPPPQDHNPQTVLTGITGSTVVVTGASRGIGRGLATSFARAGANVVLAGRDESALCDVEAEIDAMAGTGSYVVTDVTDPSALDAMAATAERRYGSLDILCANAGVFPTASVVGITAEEVDEIFAVNVRGTILAVKACLPAMRRAGRGRVIITSSITGALTGSPGWCHYGATKAAQLGYMRTAALELAADRVTINAVLPGNVLTERVAELGEEILGVMRSSIPMGRLATVEEIAAAAIFLASDQAAFITGQSLTIDGGQTLPEYNLA